MFRSKCKNRMLERVLASAVVLLIAAAAISGSSAATPVPAAKYEIPYGDFVGLSELDPVFLTNGTNPKERWTVWGQNDNNNANGTVVLAEGRETGGASAKIKCSGSEQNELFMDLFDDSALPAGDYKLRFYVKFEDGTMINRNALNTGFLVEIASWKGEATTNGFETLGSTRLVTDEAVGWNQVEIDFSVSEEVSRVRIYHAFAHCGSAETPALAYVTDYTISDQNEPEPEPEPGEKAGQVPYGDFVGLSELDPVFLTNGTNPKERWTVWGQNDNNNANGTVVLAEGRETGDLSAKIKCSGSETVELFTDLFGAYELPAGDYTLQFYVKFEDAVMINPNALNTGFLVEIASWKGEATTNGFERLGYTRLTTGAAGWNKVEIDFSVSEEVSRVRIYHAFAHCGSAETPAFAYVTDYTISDQNETEPEPEPGEKAGQVPYGDFVGLSELSPVFLTNGTDRKPRWTAWGQNDIDNVNGTVVLAEGRETGDLSAQLKCSGSETVELFTDLYDAYKLPAGDYTLKFYVKFVNAAMINPNALNTGFLVEIASWKGEATTAGFERLGYTRLITDAAGWNEIKIGFTLKEGVEAVRIYNALAHCGSAAAPAFAYVADYTITEGKDPEEPVGSSDINDPCFQKKTPLVRNDSPVGDMGDNIRGKWGIWYGSAQDGSAIPQELEDTYDFIDTGLPSGISSGIQLNPQTGAVYSLRQIIQNFNPIIEYVVRVQIKTENLEGGGACLSIGFLDAKKNGIGAVPGLITSTTPLTGTNGWTECYLKFQLPENAKDLVIGGELTNCTGKAYFTDFELLPAVYYDEGGEEKEESGTTSQESGKTEEPNQPKTGTTAAVPLAVAMTAFAAGTIGVTAAKRRREVKGQ